LKKQFFAALFLAAALAVPAQAGVNVDINVGVPFSPAPTIVAAGTSQAPL